MSTGRLSFVGLGLHDEDGITVRGLKEIVDSEVVFAESYTSALSEGAIDRLAKVAGRPIELLTRVQVEDGSMVLGQARTRKVALLVPGDPMTATTHVDLRLRAAKEGIETVTVHGSSVLTAVPGVLGLQHYKFGRTTTLPFPQEGFSPTSPYDVVAENLARGLHTLVLLDIDSENSRYMTANQGLNLLLDMERRSGKGVITEDMLVCAVARAGSPDCRAAAGKLKELMEMDFGPPLHSLVVPGKLHFMEEEAISLLRPVRKA
jgi:diphthine synthase